MFVGEASQLAFFRNSESKFPYSLHSWAADAKNGIILAGYAVEGTLAKELVREPKSVMLRHEKHSGPVAVRPLNAPPNSPSFLFFLQFMSSTGTRIDRRLDIFSVSFSAHVDYRQNSDFIKALKPAHVVRAGEAGSRSKALFVQRRQSHVPTHSQSHVSSFACTQVLVHGEEHEMLRFKKAFIDECEEEGEQAMVIRTPENTKQVRRCGSPCTALHRVCRVITAHVLRR